MSETYVVRQGDFLAKIAHQKGFGDWKTIYNDPNNASLRSLRPDPNLIAPGDHIFIPDRKKKTVPCPTSRAKRFQLHRPKSMLHLILRDNNGSR